MNVKVGDKIRMICDDELFGDFKEGDTATIVECRCFGQNRIVKWDSPLYDDVAKERNRCVVVSDDEYEVIQ